MAVASAGQGAELNAGIQSRPSCTGLHSACILLAIGCCSVIGFIHSISGRGFGSEACLWPPMNADGMSPKPRCSTRTFIRPTPRCTSRSTVRIAFMRSPEPRCHRHSDRCCPELLSESLQLVPYSWYRTGTYLVPRGTVYRYHT